MVVKDWRNTCGQPNYSRQWWCTWCCILDHIKFIPRSMCWWCSSLFHYVLQNICDLSWNFIMTLIFFSKFTKLLLALNFYRLYKSFVEDSTWYHNLFLLIIKYHKVQLIVELDEVVEVKTKGKSLPYFIYWTRISDIFHVLCLCAVAESSW